MKFLQQFYMGLHIKQLLTETIAFVNGRPLFWEEHYLRLMASMRILRMEIPLNFTPEQLLSDAVVLCLALKQPKFTGHIQFRVTKVDSPNNQNPIPSTIYAIEAFEKEYPFFISKRATSHRFIQRSLLVIRLVCEFRVFIYDVAQYGLDLYS